MIFSHLVWGDTIKYGGVGRKSQTFVASFELKLMGL